MSASTVYVVGGFGIEALDAASGVAAWSVSGGGCALAVSGSIVYVGGSFTSIGGQARNNIAALDAATGAVTAWNPNANSTVGALAVSGSTVYAVGDFTTIGGQGRAHIAAIDAASGAVTAWNPGASSGGSPASVLAVAVSGATVYVGGGFNFAGGQERFGIAALDAATGGATAWSPNANGRVWALAVSGSTVYAGGQFSHIGGQDRNNIAAIDAVTGAATTWNPNASAAVGALAVSGSRVYAGGAFNIVGGQARNRIAALDVTTGTATAWNPNADSTVLALAVSGSTVYAGGRFNIMGGQARAHIAALDAATGAVTAWNPDADTTVKYLTVSGSTVYAGGEFHFIGGQAHDLIAALDASTGTASPWIPQFATYDYDATWNYVFPIVASGAMVYVGRDSIDVSHNHHNSFMAIDAATGATVWSRDGVYHPLAVTGSTIYVTGWDLADWQGVAALDAATGVADWRVSFDLPPPSVSAMAVSGSVLYVAGDFTSIGGQARNHLAGLDAATGAVTAWNPSLQPSSPTIMALAASGSTVYVGGYFNTFDGFPQSNIAALNDPTTPVALSLASVEVASDLVRLTWSTESAGNLKATVQRSDAGSDEWVEIGAPTVSGSDKLAFEDYAVVAGMRYGYRLSVSDGGQQTTTGPTWVTVPLLATLSLAGASPNPSESGIAVRFSLPGKEPAALELFDLGGRRIASREVGLLGPGDHLVSLSERLRLSAGVYLIRLTQGGHALTAKACVVR